MAFIHIKYFLLNGECKIPNLYELPQKSNDFEKDELEKEADEEFEEKERSFYETELEDIYPGKMDFDVFRFYRQNSIKLIPLSRSETWSSFANRNLSFFGIPVASKLVKVVLLGRQLARVNFLVNPEDVIRIDNDEKESVVLYFEYTQK